MRKNSTNNSHQKTTRKRRSTVQTRSWWLEHYQAWQNSGLSKSAYCTQQGIIVSSFANWTTRFKREDSADTPASAPPPAFFRATPPSQTPQAGRIRSLTLRDLSVTFDEPIGPEAFTDWIEVLKRC